MKGMRVGALLLLVLCCSVAAIAEDVTVTTYYPSPRGVYEELRARTRIVVGPGPVPATLDMVHLLGTNANPAMLTIVNTDVPGQWMFLGMTNPNSIDLVIGEKDFFINNDPNPGTATSTFINAGLGNVGIGLSTTPSAKLQVVSPDSIGALDGFRVDTDVANGPAPFIVKSDGTVGIGIDPPLAPPTGKVQISYDSGVPAGVGNPQLRLTETQAGDYARLQFDNGSTTNFWHEAGTVGATPDVSHFNTYYNGTGDILSVEGDGRVGINTTAPGGPLHVAGNGDIFLRSTGNVAIGGAGVPPEKLSVAGNVYITQTYFCSQNAFDIAENVRGAPAPRKLEPGDVVTIDRTQDEQVMLATTAYDAGVAGVVSTKPAVLLGVDQVDKSVAVELVLGGRASTKVTMEGGPIRRGDLLVTSSKPGYAMRGDPKKITPGVVIGKAMGELKEGEGTIAALVNLQ